MPALYRLSYGFTLARGYAAACRVSLSVEFVNAGMLWRESEQREMARKMCGSVCSRQTHSYVRERQIGVQY